MYGFATLPISRPHLGFSNPFGSSRDNVRTSIRGSDRLPEWFRFHIAMKPQVNT
jgi:hypothetical protein